MAGHPTALIAVAYPLWSAGSLWTSPAAEMARAFLWLPLFLVATPWRYVWDTYLRPTYRVANATTAPGRST